MRCLLSLSPLCVWGVCALFRFDILRTSRGPFVCDVNGFSFVKSSIKYYEDCSSIIRLYFLNKLAYRCCRAALHAPLPSSSGTASSASSSASASAAAAAAAEQQQQQQQQQHNLELYLAQQQRRCPHEEARLPDLFWVPGGPLPPPHLGEEETPPQRMARCLCMALETPQETAEVDEELRTVVVVMRHGDRRPKQKLKFLSTQPLLLQYFQQQQHFKKEIKLKSPEELRDLLERNTDIITALVRITRGFAAA